VKGVEGESHKMCPPQPQGVGVGCGGESNADMSATTTGGVGDGGLVTNEQDNNGIAHQ
jgi:hypothetical protein